jgi:hypothetical protein
MKFTAHTLTQDGTLTAFVDNKHYVVAKSHPNYSNLIRNFKDKDADAFVKNYSVENTLKQAFTGTKVTVQNGNVYYAGEVVNNCVADRILQMLREGFDIKPMTLFLEKLMLNPSNNSVVQGFNFLQHKNLPICEDGDFLAYKTVRSNYLDKYSGTIDNTPSTPTKPNVIDWRHKRNKISDNPSSHCSEGLHVGALSYAGPGGWYNSSADKFVIVKVNPMDMVSVPNDHEFTKMRVCRYEVVADYVAPLTRSVYNTESTQEWDYSVEQYQVDESLDEVYDDSAELDDLDYGDRVEFTYTNREGQTETRYVEVDEVNRGTLCGTVIKGDPSYDTYSENYRRFNSAYMKDLKFIYN